jgi:WD40 repeat protein
MSNLLALANGTELVGDYRIRRVLGAGGFGITYLADELALSRLVTIKEYFPADFAARGRGLDAAPRSKDCAADYKWGLDRFIEEAQTLARFEHANIVRVFRYFRANNTGYMVLQWEEGQSLKSWLKDLGRAPRQEELDRILGPLLDALEVVHRSDFLHRDIAPDNIIIRADRSPVLIDFGSARGEIASHSRTVSALVKPGYSPYEQYATTTSQQGPWTDIYALGATLYQAVTGKRPPDAPSRVVSDDYVPARQAALGSFRPGFLAAIDKALAIEPKDRPQSVLAWRGALLAPVEKPPPKKARIGTNLGLKKADATAKVVAPARPPPGAPVALPSSLEQGAALLEAPAPAKAPAKKVDPVAPATLRARLAAEAPVDKPRYGLGYGPAPTEPAAAARIAAPVALAVAAPAAAAPVPRPIRRRRALRASSVLFFLRPPWRGYLFKFGVGAAMASYLVSLQGDVAPPAVGPAARTAKQVPSSATTEVRPPPVPAPLPVPVLQLPGHDGPVLALALLPAGRGVASVGADAVLRISDAETGALARSLPLSSAPAPLTVQALPAGGSGSALVSAAIHGQTLTTVHGNGSISTWDIDRGDLITTARRGDGDVRVVAGPTDTDRLVGGGSDGRLALFERNGSGASTTSSEAHGEAVTALSPVPGRSTIASAGADRTVKLWSTETLRLVRTYRGHTGAVTALDVTSDGRTIASGAEDGQVRLWSTSSPRLIRTLRGHTGRVTSIAHGPAGDVVAAAAADGTVRLWNAKTGAWVTTLAPRTGGIRGLAFLPDGRRLITAGEDGSVKVWDVAAFRVARE